MVSINQACSTTETAFNIAGSVPVLGMVSGEIRVYLGVIQFKTGAIFAVMGFIGQTVGQDTKKWENVSAQGVEHSMHGVLNIIRGLSEVLMGAIFIGSFILLGYQIYDDNHFKPQVAYTNVDSSTLPIIQFQRHFI